MKTLMKVSGIGGIGLFLIGLFMKVKHLEGAGIIFTLAFLILIAAYLPALTLTVRKEKILANKMPLFYFGVISVFFALISFVFSMMHWPLKVYPVVAYWISMAIFLGFFFHHTLKNQENRIINLSVLLVLAIVLLGYVYNFAVNTMNPAREVFVIEHNLSEAEIYFELKVKNLENQLSMGLVDSSNLNNYLEFVHLSNQLAQQTRELRTELFSSPESLGEYNKKFLKNHQIKSELDQRLQKFMEEVVMYRDFALKLVNESENSELSDLVKKTLVFDRLDRFSNTIVLYNNLTRFSQDIRMIEAELLQAEL